MTLGTGSIKEGHNTRDTAGNLWGAASTWYTIWIPRSGESERVPVRHVRMKISSQSFIPGCRSQNDACQACGWQAWKFGSVPSQMLPLEMRTRGEQTGARAGLQINLQRDTSINKFWLSPPLSSRDGQLDTNLLKCKTQDKNIPVCTRKHTLLPKYSIQWFVLIGEDVAALNTTEGCCQMWSDQKWFKRRKKRSGRKKKEPLCWVSSTMLRSNRCFSHHIYFETAQHYKVSISVVGKDKSHLQSENMLLSRIKNVHILSALY